MENKREKRSVKQVVLCLALTALILICGGVGYVLAQLSALLNIGGEVSFSANNVYATIFDGTVSGGTLANSENKLKNVVFDANDSSDVSTTSLATWSNLDIDFNQNGDDVSISFKVLNYHTEKNLKLSVGTIGGTYTNVSQTITIGGSIKDSDEYVILAMNGAHVEVIITFGIIDKNKSAKIENFSFNFNLTNTTDSATINTLAYRYTEDGTGIYFGSYPQTIKDSSVTVGEVVDENGYYTGSDGKKYAKYTVDYASLGSGIDGEKLDIFFADEYNLNLASDGTHMQTGTDYYFKVEDLEWRILTSEDNMALIMCTSIIKAQDFQSNIKYDGTDKCYYAKDNEGNILTDNEGNKIYANNYEYSTLRKYLIEDFYNSTFTDLQKELIQEILVDNSASTTGKENNPFACNDTNDKIFVLSRQEMSSLFFDGNDEIDMSNYLDYFLPTTDYAKANGAMIYTKELCEVLGATTGAVLEACGKLYNGDDGETITYDECTPEQKAVLDIVYATSVGGVWTRSPLDSSSTNGANVVNGNSSIFESSLFGSHYADFPCGIAPAMIIQL